MAEVNEDKEVALYRGLLETPEEFKDGFGWTTLVGILFCGLIMLPGSIYLGLMSGGGIVNQAAAWVTLILFSEIARRSLKTMNKQQLVTLLHAAQVVMAANILYPGGPVAQLVFRAYLVGSDAMRDSGMSAYFPWWWVPSADSSAVAGRNLLDPAWLVPIGILLLMVTIGTIKRYTLGYFFFRLTSDVEDLPFPLAPVQAQGAMALAEHDEQDDQAEGEGEDPGKAFFTKGLEQHRKKSERWRLFSLGAMIGVVFGFFQLGIPALTSVLFSHAVFLIPQPFIDTTTLTQSLLPATPTGVALDLGILITGMVLPFWAVMGTFFAITLTIVANPILHHTGILTAWQPGMDAVNTTFANEKNFWMSFTIGVSLGLLAVSLYQSFRDLWRKSRAARERRMERGGEKEDMWAYPAEGRGDFPLWVALSAYGLAGLVTVGLSYVLLRTSPFMGAGTVLTVTLFVFFFVFVYTPLISYLNARLVGIAGQTVEIPYLRQTAFILSGARGLSIWMIPSPIEDYGKQAQAFRAMELTGTSFWSILKTDLVAMPILFLLSFAFWAFIWAGHDIPGPTFPFADVFWELQSKRMALQYSATFVTHGGQAVNFWQTQFGHAIKPTVIGVGAGSTLLGFVFMSIFGMPVMFIYGVIKGVGQFPHLFVMEIIGAFIGRFYFQKKFGRERFLRMVPTILAGYFTGVGLIGMATVAMDLIKKAISTAPF